MYPYPDPYQFQSKYDVTPLTQKERRLPRDQIRFPNALPANSHYPIHQMDYEFRDRQFKNDRQQKFGTPVQNDYMQKYQIHQLQQNQYLRQDLEQSFVNQDMQRKIPTDNNMLGRNFDDAQWMQNPSPGALPDFRMPQDTRREKVELNPKDREPLGKVMGAPVLPYRN